MYFLTYNRKAAKDLQNISEPYKSNIIERIQALKENPYPDNSRKLKKIKEKKYKIRVGDYRVVYSISTKTILIEIVKHRRESYRFLLLNM